MLDDEGRDGGPGFALELLIPSSDRSAGAVMESAGYTHKVGVDVVTFYSASVTKTDGPFPIAEHVSIEDH